MSCNCKATNGAGHPTSCFEAQSTSEQQNQRGDLRIANGENRLQPTTLPLGIIVLNYLGFGFAETHGSVPIKILHRIDVSIQRFRNMDQGCCDASIFIKRGRNLAPVRLFKGRRRGRNQDRILHALLSNQFNTIGPQNGDGKEIAKGEFRTQAFRECEGRFR